MITFERLSSLQGVVPLNLLPAALPDVLAYPDNAATLPTLYRRNADRDLLLQPLPDLFGLIDKTDAFDTDMGVFLGPRVPSGTERVDTPLPFPVERFSPGRSRPTVVGIVDAGIAFWNPAFRHGRDRGKSRFVTMGALTAGGGGEVASTVLDAAAITSLLAQDDHLIRARLAQVFPDSVYGDKAQVPLFQPEGLAHGTAMADLILTNAGTRAELHGLELPVTALRDLTGGQMSAVMDAALSALVAQANATPALKDREFNMVVLMAFGFTGGPQDGSAEILGPIEATLAALKSKGISVTLVLPVGNQLQDRLHAVLEPWQRVGWRHLPDDHSANTVEIIQQSGAAPLHLAAPDGSGSTLPAETGLYRVTFRGAGIGAVWVSALKDGRLRSRVTLAPTTPSAISATPSPFGRWTLSSGESYAQLWILRDETGFDASRADTARASWFEDDAYRFTDDLGYPLRQDPLQHPSVIRRSGAASVLATSASPHVVVVSAASGTTGQRTPATSFYASQKPAHVTSFASVDLAGQGRHPRPPEELPLGPFGGRAVLGNGGPKRFRAAGTSLAAALEAGRRTP